MNSKKLKKVLSTSIASLTIFSTLSGSISSKVYATDDMEYTFTFSCDGHDYEIDCRNLCVNDDSRKMVGKFIAAASLYKHARRMKIEGRERVKLNDNEITRKVLSRFSELDFEEEYAINTLAPVIAALRIMIPTATVEQIQNTPSVNRDQNRPQGNVAPVEEVSNNQNQNESQGSVAPAEVISSNESQKSVMPEKTVSNEDDNKPTKKENSANSSSQTAPTATENRGPKIRNLEDLPFGRILVRAGRFIKGIFQRIYRMFNNN